MPLTEELFRDGSRPEMRTSPLNFSASTSVLLRTSGKGADKKRAACTSYVPTSVHAHPNNPKEGLTKHPIMLAQSLKLNGLHHAPVIPS